MRLEKNSWLAALVFLAVACDKADLPPEGLTNKLNMAVTELSVNQNYQLKVSSTVNRGDNDTSLAYLNISEHGHVIGTQPLPLVGAAVSSNEGERQCAGTFTSTFDELLPATTYYCRAWLLIDGNYVYGAQDSVRTPCPCAEQEALHYLGHNYPLVSIGKQCWMQQNLRAGIVLPPTQQQSIAAPLEKYCYNNDCTGDEGAFYQWYEAIDYSEETGRGVCPAGWHIPAIEEWQELLDAVNQNAVSLTAGSEGMPANADSAGFAGVLGGIVLSGQAQPFHNQEKVGYWWSSTQLGGSAQCFSLSHAYTQANLIELPIEAGANVRCLKDR